jgi:tyrosine-protein kinase Etk/Wzc
VRLAISQAFLPGQPIAVTITSPGQGEGKSLVSENLALAFADGGYKTLLIDGDTRRGELHSTFGVERRAGLLDHLAGRTALSDIVKETSTKNLWLLPAGTRFKRGPELLMSPALAPMLAELTLQYDAILIDTPPLSAGVDALVLGSTVGNMLMVVRHGKTDRKMAGAKLELVDRLPVRVLGAVLNDTRGGWGYEQYAYVDGYAAEEELGEIDLGNPSLGSPGNGKSLASKNR